MAKHYKLLSERTNAIRKDSAIHRVLAALEKLGPMSCTALAAHIGVGVNVVYGHIYTLHESTPRKIHVSRWVLINNRTLQAEFSAGNLPDVPRPYGILAATRMAKDGDPTVRIAGDDHLTFHEHKQARQRASNGVVTKKDGYCKYNGSILTRFAGGINPWTGAKSHVAA